MDLVAGQESLRGPKGGYGFANKEAYRQQLWSTIQRNLGDLSSARVLMLPGSEGHEIRTALQYGVRPENIVAIDENPAVIATAKWRKSFPEIRVYAGRFSRVAKRLKENGHCFDVVNLDFCYSLGEPLLQEVSALRQAICRSGCAVAITMLKGRESHAVHTLARRLHPYWWKHNWPNRLVIVFVESFMNERDHRIQEITYEPLIFGEYRSGGGSKAYMLWGLCRVWRTDDLKQKMRSIAQKYDRAAISTLKAYSLAEHACFGMNQERWRRLKEMAERRHALYVRAMLTEIEDFSVRFCPEASHCVYDLGEPHYAVDGFKSRVIYKGYDHELGWRKRERKNSNRRILLLRSMERPRQLEVEYGRTP